MTSFNYAYDLSAVRDWLFAQMRTVVESGLLNLFRLTENQAKYE